LAQLRAQLGGEVHEGLEGHPAFRTVKSMLEKAKLDLARTVVRAPFDGVVGRTPLVGHYVAAGAPVISLVAERGMWIEANYKETELTHIQPGQPVVIRIDAYPDSEWYGDVESISPATGAEFSVIPAQNASGNWVKVAQRIPVRIALREAADTPVLRTGMSAIVEIDTGFERRPPRFLGFLQTLRVTEPAHAARE
jgi:membrane fusion protein, multidrug efflux system